MRECSKAIARRLQDSRYVSRYFSGNGIDIGGKPDPLNLYNEFFPLMKSCKTWDLEDGDAQYMENIKDESLDFLHSSHCLEHMVNPIEALNNWVRIVKKGGHLIITVPDEDLYEQGTFPSTRNLDHKWTFTIFKQTSWSEKSINIVDLVQQSKFDFEITKIELIDQNFRYDLPNYDQTRTPVAECSIELILRRRTDREIKEKGRVPIAKRPDTEKRIHLNQYVEDQLYMKTGKPPFQNDDWE